MHRMMNHVYDHFMSFGCARHGDTDDNETRHKRKKSCYSTTNHKIVDLTKQLVAVCSIAEASSLIMSDTKWDE